MWWDVTFPPLCALKNPWAAKCHPCPAAPLVHATQQLFLNFADRPDVPSLQQMAAQFTAIRTELTSKVMHRFPAYDPTVDGPPPPDMTDACAVIDAVGGEV